MSLMTNLKSSYFQRPIHESTVFPLSVNYNIPEIVVNLVALSPNVVPSSFNYDSRLTFQSNPFAGWSPRLSFNV